jgi:hypothetical protein
MDTCGAGSATICERNATRRELTFDATDFFDHTLAAAILIM